MAHSAPSGALGLSLRRVGAGQPRPRERHPLRLLIGLKLTWPQAPMRRVSAHPGPSRQQEQVVYREPNAPQPRPGLTCPSCTGARSVCPLARTESVNSPTWQKSSQPAGRGLKVHSPQPASLPGAGGGWGCVEVPEIQCPSSTAPASVQTYGPWPRLAEGRQTPQTPAVSSPSWQRGRQ